MVKGHIGGQWCFTPGELVPQKSGEYYTLLIVTEELQQPKFAASTAMAT